MNALVVYKVTFQGSLLNDLPNELKYRVLDYLDASSLKKCRLVSKIFCEMISNCDKYNKHWVLDVSHWPVTADQEYVQLFTKSNLKFGRFVGYTEKFTKIPKLFQKLGQTVTHIEDLPFDKMDFETTETMIKHFDKVEDLTLKDNRLLRNMQRWNLVWPSVKRLTIVAGGGNVKYKGNYSQFPNIEEINIAGFNIMLDVALDLIKVCPEKVTEIKEMFRVFYVTDPCVEFNKMENLSLKKFKGYYVGTEAQDEFLSSQKEITSYDFWVKLSDDEDYFSFTNLLPGSVNLQNLHSLTVELKCETEFDLKVLHTMPNLKKFGISLGVGFRHYQSEELQTCFLQSHEVCLNNQVTSLFVDTRSLHLDCRKCMRTLLSSFTRLTKLKFGSVGFATKKNFYLFWKMVNDVIKKTGVSKLLTIFELLLDDHSTKIDCEVYNFFKVMTPLPQVKQVHFDICLNNLSQNMLKTFCDKCPAVERLMIGIGRERDFHLSGFLIHQLKCMKFLQVSDQSSSRTMWDDDNIKDLVADASIIEMLLKVPLKLWTLELPIRCESKDLFPLFEKFPTLREVHVHEKRNKDDDDSDSDDEEKTYRLFRTAFYDDMKKRSKRKSLPRAAKTK